MNLSEALEQIDTIHAHLARGEQYRGYRPLALALSGAAGLAAALLQATIVADSDALGFACYWLVTALVCGGLAGGATLLGYCFREDDLARRRTRIVLRQFLPCLCVGAIVTAALLHPQRRDAAVALLPGLWALVFGLGTVASLPYLPRRAGLVAAWYLAAGAAALYLAEGPVPSGWAVGLPFGLGQLFAALVLFKAGQGEDRP